MGPLTPGKRKGREWRGTKSLPINRALGVHLLNDLVDTKASPRNSTVVMPLPGRISKKVAEWANAMADESLVDMQSRAAGTSQMGEERKKTFGDVSQGRRSSSAGWDSWPSIAGALYYLILTPNIAWGVTSVRK